MKKNYIFFIVNRFLIKTFICVLLFLIILICNKKYDNFKIMLYKKVYNNTFSFSKINHWFESNFGNIFPINTIDEVQIFNETIIYDNKEKYYDGVKLKLRDNYVIPSLSNGIVIFIGEKDDLGKTIIIEDENGLDIWYSNISTININIYDYVSKGDYIGEAINNELILLFQKDGKNEDYNKYI